MIAISQNMFTVREQTPHRRWRVSSLLAAAIRRRGWETSPTAFSGQVKLSNLAYDFSRAYVVGDILVHL